jgi:alpha-tubulin suppressor-like RCC1 family protein
LKRKGTLLLVGVATAALLGTQGTAAAAPAAVDLDGSPVRAEQPVGFEQARRTPVADGAPAARPQARTAAAEAAAVDSSGSVYVPMSPVRVFDTRAASPLGPGGSSTLSLANRVPEGTTAVVLNVTGVSPSLATFVTVWPAGTDRPDVSNVNLRAGEIRANAATIALNGPGRDLSVYNNSGNTHVVVDLAGYYIAGTGSKFTAQSPVRVLDTRTSGGALGAGATRVLDLSARVPATATAVTFNLTGASATANTFVTAWPGGTTRPTASQLNLVPGQVTPNQVTVALSADRKVALYNNSGNTHLIADLAGYYATDRGDPYYQLSPVRLFDSRFGEPLGAGTTGTIGLDTDLPAAASAVTFNLTGTGPTASTFLTAFPAGATRPNASNLNLVAGQTAANLVTVALGNRSVSVYNLAGNTDFLMDLAGYFAPAPAACATDCVHSWADNTVGQLGVGTVGGFSTTPGRVDGLSGVTAVTGSFPNGYALKSDGTVWAWGDNSWQGLGNGKSYGNDPVPAKVGSLSGVTQIAAGAYSGYALRGNGEVWAWGYNGDGSLGAGNVSPQSSPVKVNTPSGITQIAAGYTTAYALRNDGTVWAWGANGSSLGNGFYGSGCETTPVGAGCRAVTPVQVPNLTGVVSIAATRNATFAVKNDGTVWTWGFNAHGELGIGTVGGPGCFDNPQGTNCVALSPVQIPGLAGVAEVASGSVSTTYAIKTDGTALAWGWNGEGQLGNGTTGGECTDPSTPDCVATSPVAVSGLTNVTELAGGNGYALALSSDGLAYGWGWSPQGQAGGASVTGVPEPVGQVTGVHTVGSGGTTSYLVK